MQRHKRGMSQKLKLIAYNVTLTNTLPPLVHRTSQMQMYVYAVVRRAAIMIISVGVHNHEHGESKVCMHTPAASSLSLSFLLYPLPECRVTPAVFGDYT